LTLVPATGRGAITVSAPASISDAEAVLRHIPLPAAGRSAAELELNALAPQPRAIPLDDRPLRPPPPGQRDEKRGARRTATLAPLLKPRASHNTRGSNAQPTEQPSPDLVEEERQGQKENVVAEAASPAKMPTPFKSRLKIGRSPPISSR